ncbi:GT-D fold domain-containing glycosyltransferase [Paenibacillus silvisoli]|uniref:GT-D fold domain-containing glycosyltransferase n=1 Tax=Paenibacillus silvisoli TaxID=3110539 RepID=UPI002803CDEE|nr:GT-D fold domain-containing glycosyltransferase [Paenibacillus silvisoli]
MAYEELTSGQVLDRILYSLERRLPLSVISVGVTETHVLAQYEVYTEEQFMNHPEANVANYSKIKRGHQHRGITFPNIEARDAALEAVRKADIVGINIRVSRSGEFTRQVFDFYGIAPDFVFEAYTRRVMMISQQRKFHAMLTNRKIVIVCGYADEVKKALENQLQAELNFCITGTIKIDRYEDIPRVKQELMKSEFDLCLLAAGTNAVILAPYIAKDLGKVALDLGQGMETLITGKIEGEAWLAGQIELTKLLDM